MVTGAAFQVQLLARHLSDVERYRILRHEDLTDSVIPFEHVIRSGDGMDKT